MLLEVGDLGGCSKWWCQVITSGLLFFDPFFVTHFFSITQCQLHSLILCHYLCLQGTATNWLLGRAETATMFSSETWPVSRPLLITWQLRLHQGRRSAFYYIIIIVITDIISVAPPLSRVRIVFSSLKTMRKFAITLAFTSAYPHQLLQLKDFANRFGETT